MFAIPLSLILLSFAPVPQNAVPDRPGLIATASDGETTVQFVDAKVAGAWPEGHAPHPALRSDSFTIQWNGYIKIPREGRYRLAADATGPIECRLGGQSIFQSGAAESAWLPLKAGETPLEVKFTKIEGAAGTARVALQWESEDFARVSVPATACVHAEQAETPQVLARARREEGSVLFENLRCGSCHERSDAAKPMPAPVLAGAGSRFNASWVYEYLRNPPGHRQGLEMPSLFAPDESSAQPRADVARYLASLKSRDQSPKSDHNPNAEQGKKLFAFRGCVACHNSPEGELAPEEIPRAPLFNVGSKYADARALADFLQDPLKSHPAGTMPKLQMSREECLDLSVYLMKARDAAFERALPAPPDSDVQSVERGRALVQQRGCIACHEIDPAAKDHGLAGPSLQKGSAATGCARPAPGSRNPAYALSDDSVEALRAFVSTPAEARPSKSMTYQSQRTIARLGCLQCHAREGQGAGEKLYELQKTAIEESHHAEIAQIGPPDLTRAGEKLRPEWLREMFISDRRARPWVQVRMPNFGAVAEPLATGLCALDGMTLETNLEPAVTQGDVGLIGQDLIGKKGFNCINCHDLAGSPASVAFIDSRGPDLILSPGRIRYSWFRMWVIDPQALVPGTKMPTFFPGGATTLPGRHGLEGEAQIHALYDYLRLGDKAPLPAGLGNSSGWSWIVNDRPAIIRTPFDEAPRAVCVGFPGGLSLAFDAVYCRVFKMWKGGFLRMNGTQWTGQHGPYPHPEGDILLQADGRQPEWFSMPAESELIPPRLKREKPRYIGYAEHNGNYTFKFGVPCGQGEALVEETFACASGGDDWRVDRIVEIRNLPVGTDLVCWLGEPARSGDKLKIAPSTRVAGDGCDFVSVGNTEVDGKRGSYARCGTRKGLKELKLTISWYTTGDRPPLKPIPSAFDTAESSTDPFELSPRVEPSFEGHPPKEKNPWAKEEKHYAIEQIPIPGDIVLQVGGLDFLSNGSLAICTRRGEVWILDNATKGAREHKWHRFAHGLHEPLGLKVVNDEIYVLQKPELTKLVDTDRDGVADEYQCYNAGWELSTNFHEFAFGLEYKDGSFYGTLGLAIVPGGATRQEQVFARGSAWRVDQDRKFEVLALGLRTPNGTGLGANGEFYYSDNQGDYIPACKLQEVRKGEFYGQRFALPDRDAKVDVTPPVCWFPYNTTSESASDILLESQDGKFGPFAGQLLVGEFTNSQILRVQLERVRGRDQGTVWIFRRGFSSGLERMVWGPDGKLYVGCTTGGWGAVGPKLFSLERVSYLGKTPFEMKTVHLLRDGFEIEFTKPLAPALAGVAEDARPYASVEQFHYHYWATYGSPEIDRKTHNVSDFTVSPDRRKVTFKVEGMVADRICEIRLRNISSEDGEPLVHTEAWYTLNAFPE
jgi:cytochrome c551/c552/glucose/arabinose dehydrogenase